MIQLTVDTAGKMCEPAVFKRQLLFCFRAMRTLVLIPAEMNP